MIIRNTKTEKPPTGYNVLVKHTIHYQDFWTRGFLIQNQWKTMTWSGEVVVPVDSITEWMFLPNHNKS